MNSHTGQLFTNSGKILIIFCAINDIQRVSNLAARILKCYFPVNQALKNMTILQIKKPNQTTIAVVTPDSSPWYPKI